MAVEDQCLLIMSMLSFMIMHMIMIMIYDAGNAETQREEKANHIRAEYEKRLSFMQAELRKLEAAKMEHLKLLRNQTHTEKQLKAYEHDLTEMKKLKVKQERLHAL